MTTFLALSEHQTGELLKQDDQRIFLRPHPLLRSYIAHYTVLVPGCGGQPPAAPLTLIPDASGCVVFHLYGNGVTSVFWGPTTRTVQVGDDPSPAPPRLFVEFRPCGAHRFTGVPLCDTTDQRISSDLLLQGLQPEVERMVETARCIQDYADVMDAWFLARLKQGSVGTVEQLVPFAARLSVRELSLEAGYSERHLSRMFRQELGMNVKTYARLAKVNRALQRMKEGGCTLTALAQDGWFDQAHFIHDFELVCGVAPSAYLREKSDFYNEDFKF